MKVCLAVLAPRPACNVILGLISLLLVDRDLVAWRIVGELKQWRMS